MAALSERSAVPLSVPQLLPPSDLLEQVQGVEDGLLRRRRLQWLGVLLAAIQVTVLLLNSDWLQALFSADWSAVADQWWLIAILFVLVLSVLLVSWTRFWLGESKKPFHYTFAISPFDAVTEADADPLMSPLQTDLLEKLSRRVGRLSRLVEDEAHNAHGDAADTTSARSGVETTGSSHIDVSGYYAKRRRRPDPYWAVEVTAWVRVGDPSRPATLAPPVRYSIAGAKGDEPPSLDQTQYEEVLERAYSSVATAIYNQIQQDVARKIALLPSRYFRAAAYFYEAEDYAHSNTLDAYDRALELFDAALKVYDPNWKPVSRARMRRPLRKLRQVFAIAFQRLRRAASHVVARVGKSEVLAARAQIGYANTLLYRRILASLAGRGVNPMFEALPIADRAVKRLDDLAADVPGQEETLFDAFVARALAYASMNRSDKAEGDLAEARARSPYRAEEDPRFLFVSGLLEVEVLTALPRLRRAVEFDPQFEAAQFRLAYNLEMLWRLRPGLEENVAEMVFEEYESVVRLNPGNVAAWADLGYMRWMLAGFEQRKGAKRVAHAALARDAFESGRQYKEIKREAFVGVLDHGLARLAAEDGRFKEAYRHYVSMVAAIMTQGRSGAHESYRAYQLSLISDKMLERFTEYRDAVRAAWEHPRPEELANTTPRVRDSVYAFALNDFAEASYHYYLRSGDLDALDAAQSALNEATEELHTSYILAYVNLALVERERSQALEFFADDDPGGAHLDFVDKSEPAWAEGNLITLVRCTERAKSAREKATVLRHDAYKKQEQASDSRKKALGGAVSPWAPDSDMGSATSASYVADHGSGVVSDAESDALEAGAWELEYQAKELEAEADERERRARRLTLSLLPHEWLWRRSYAVCDDPNDIPEAELDTRALKRRDYRRELKWERSFDDFHVRALVSWCERRRLAGDGNGRLIENVLDLIEERFAPGNADLLMKRRGTPNGTRSAPRRIPFRRPTSRPREDDRELAIQGILLRHHTADPYAYSTLAALRDDSVPESTRKRLYIDAASKGGRPATLYRWLGDRLLEAGAYDEGLAAYERAAETSHPLTLLELGQQFQAIGMQDMALQCLRRAAGVDHADPIVRVFVARSLTELGAVDDAVQCLDKAQATDDPSLLSEIAAGYESARLWNKCEELYRRAAELDAVRAEPVHTDGFYRLGIGRALWHLGRAREAVDELVHVRGDPQVSPYWRSALVDELVDENLVSRTEYCLLQALLLADQRFGGWPEDVADAGAALLSLAHSADTGLAASGAGSHPDMDIPARLPITLAADQPRFFKLFGETPAVKRMIDADLPAVQARVRAERGVYMPGVRISGAHDFAQREYRLLIHEVPLERGRVPRGLDDPHAFMLDRLERLVESNLAAFVDAESVESLLQEWQSKDYREHGELRARVLSSNESFRRFVRIIEALVREAVPVGDIGAIVRQFDGRDLSKIPLNVAVDDVRLALRESLPGLDGRQVVPFPEDIEKVLADAWERSGRTTVALSVAEVARLRELVRRAEARQESELFAWRVGDAGLRFFANRLVEMDYTTVPVVSDREAETQPAHALRTTTAGLLSRAHSPAVRR